MHSFFNSLGAFIKYTDTTISLYICGQLYPRSNNIYKTKHFYCRSLYLYTPCKIIYGGRKA